LEVKTKYHKFVSSSRNEKTEEQFFKKDKWYKKSLKNLQNNLEVKTKYHKFVSSSRNEKTEE